MARFVVFVLSSLLVAACARHETTTCPGGHCPDLGTHGGTDAGTADVIDYSDAPPVNPCAPACGPTELCGDMNDGNGLDDNCNGVVDEGCTCVYGSTRACFLGPPDRRGVGACADGIETCSEFGQYGPCQGGNGPSAETCDGLDNDCNAMIDDGIAGCSSALTCPPSLGAMPLSTFNLNGTGIYGGVATNWSWTISCPPTVSTCPTPASPTSRDTTVYFVASGSYRAHVSFTTSDGATLSCDFVIYVEGQGLRVELNWDTQGTASGDTDVDLHLHRRSVPDGVTTGETEFFTDDDCYFANCKATSNIFIPSPIRTHWALPDTTDLAVCDTAPHGEGAQWTMLGACYNPRLDVDTIYCTTGVTDPTAGDFCAPENINVDDPPNGSTYRVMVNYYSQHTFGGTTHPSVNIYCGGELRATYGVDTTLINLRNGSDYGAPNDNWHVADVKMFTNSCGQTDCMIVPINTIVRGAAFTEPWSF